MTIEPYYADEWVTLYHGDCREITAWLDADVLVTDPPYPNNAGHFDDAVPVARGVLSSTNHSEALIFWTELEIPPFGHPLVGVHIWHRANVNGRPYEPVFHFASDGSKRRSEVLRFAVEFEGATGGDYFHPTQKPVALMQRLATKTRPSASIADPFAGSGTTLVAAKRLGRKAIGIELEERYCEIAAKRLSQGVLDFGGAA